MSSVLRPLVAQRKNCLFPVSYKGKNNYPERIKDVRLGFQEADVLDLIIDCHY